jgi:uncharacterized protein (TIGR03435 family)
MPKLAAQKKSARTTVPPWKLCQRTLLLFSALFCGFGQSADTPVAFEVAAINKSAMPAGGRGAPSTGDFPILGVTASRLEIRNYTLTKWIAYAYDVPEFEISGPDWISREKYDLSAKLPQGSTKRDAPAMLQSLLAERFELRIHRQARKMSGYALVVGKTGARLKPSLSFGKGSDFEASPLLSTNPERVEYVYKNCTMSHFAQLLSQLVREPVVDATNLAGAYDLPFHVAIRDLLPQANPIDGGDDGLGPSIVDSVKGLGLTLERKGVAVEAVVVDSISLPTAN